MSGDRAQPLLALDEQGATIDLARAVRLHRAQDRFNEAVLAHDEVEGLATAIVEAMAAQLGVAGGALALAREEGTVLTLAHQRGCGAAEIALIDPLNLRDPGPSPGKDAVLARRALVVPLHGRQVLLVPLVIRLPAHGIVPDRAPGTESRTGPSLERVPGDRAVGLLLATSPSSGRFSEDDLAFVESVRTSTSRALDGALRGVALTRSREALERVNLEFRGMVRDLSVANEKLKELDRLKDLFVSSVSHELRTPLTSIRGFAEILLDYGTDDPKVCREFLTIIRDESDRLGRLIRNILDLSRLEAGERHWERTSVHIADVVSAAASILKAQLSAEGRRFEQSVGPDLPSAVGDRDGLIQVLVNLLGNAAKFTRPGGSIRVSAALCGPDGADGGEGSIRVDVSDDGVGIPAGEQSRIFERFRQVEVSSSAGGKAAGTGLGLAICREILTHLGGRIWVESAERRGSVFRFTLPVRSQQS